VPWPVELGDEIAVDGHPWPLGVVDLVWAAGRGAGRGDREGTAVRAHHPRRQRGQDVTAAHRRSFTSSELDELRRLVREKQTSDRDRQKALRSKMRRIGFYISDFTDDPEGSSRPTWTS
jgi:hypothetical protein